MWHFVEHGAPYHAEEQYLNSYVNKILARSRTWPEIVIFTKGPCLGPNSGGRVYASTPILHDRVEGH